MFQKYHGLLPQFKCRVLGRLWSTWNPSKCSMADQLYNIEPLMSHLGKQQEQKCNQNRCYLNPSPVSCFSGNSPCCYYFFHFFYHCCHCCYFYCFILILLLWLLLPLPPPPLLSFPLIISYYFSFFLLLVADYLLLYIHHVLPTTPFGHYLARTATSCLPTTYYVLLATY